MKSPFPGMDPYLEAHWGDVHTRLILYACDQINPQLPTDLIARVEEYLALETDDPEDPHGCYPDIRVSEQPGHGAGLPSVAVGTVAVAVAEPLIIPLPVEPPTLRSIRIYDRHSGNRIITAIEILSPANKVGEEGRRAYRRKRHDLLSGGVNVVEIDLLREGAYVLFPPEASLPPSRRGPYRISVVRGNRGDQAEVYRVPLRERLPAIRIPLRSTDLDVVLDLQPLIDQCYANGRYDRDINYRVDAEPPLQGDDAVWADALLREQGRR